MRRLARADARRGGGNIVLLGSIDGVKPAPSPVHYAASKAALAGWCGRWPRSSGREASASTASRPACSKAACRATLPEPLRREYLKHCGLKRLGRMEEVASLVAWLAVENTLVTGQTLVLDGAL